MNKTLFVLLTISCVSLSSCVPLTKKGAWLDKRSEARATGGTTWTNFVIKDLSRMDSYLSYDQQMLDVQSAIPYASPQDKIFLAGVKQRMARDKVASAQRQAMAGTRTNQQFNSYGNSSGYNSSGYTQQTTDRYNSAVDHAAEQERVRVRDSQW